MFCVVLHTDFLHFDFLEHNYLGLDVSWSVCCLHLDCRFCLCNLHEGHIVLPPLRELLVELCWRVKKGKTNYSNETEKLQLLHLNRSQCFFYTGIIH